MAALVRFPNTHPRDPRNAVVERAMECQVAADDLWRATVRTNDYVLLADADTLRGLLRTATAVARRIAGNAEGHCADGIRRPGHGRAS